MATIIPTVNELIPELNGRVLYLYSDATMDGQDSMTVNIADYGCTKLGPVILCNHLTTGSHTIVEAANMSLSSTYTLNIKVPGGDNLVRSAIVYAYR